MDLWMSISATIIYYFINNVFCAPNNTTESFLNVINANGTFNATFSLQYKHIYNYCNSTNQRLICESDSTRVCAGRRSNKTETGEELEKKEFDNACYLFLKNVCENAKNPYYIISPGSCAANNSNPSRKNFKPVYKKEVVPFCYPEHRCPLSCPNVYKPICLNINRDENKYMKIYSFMNHCLGDVFYCSHPEEFTRAPAERQEQTSEEPDVRSSQLSWSDCAHSKFTAFSRFTEVASSMGHYGWLAGDFRASRILEPHERVPEFAAPKRKIT